MVYLQKFFLAMLLLTLTSVSWAADGYCFDESQRIYYKSKPCLGRDLNITRQEFDNKHLSPSTTVSSSSQPIYCYDSKTEIWYKKERYCVQGDRQITKKEFDNRRLYSSSGLFVAKESQNKPLGYCYYPRTQLFYVRDTARCPHGDPEVTKQEFENRIAASVAFSVGRDRWFWADFQPRNGNHWTLNGWVIEAKQGEIIFPDGSAYTGPFRRGKWHGFGSYTFSDSGLYVGEFSSGHAHGRGVLILSDGARFDGEFRNGKKWIGTQFDKYGNVVSFSSNKAGQRKPF